MTDPARILVVDDDRDTLELLRELMVKEGYHVRAVSNAEAALAAMAKEEPNLVISDIQMPGMDGLALLAETRKRYPEALVILLTAYGSLATAVEGIKAGAFDYLSKPFLVEEIRLLVRRALEHRRVLNENKTLREQLKQHQPSQLDLILGMSAPMVGVYKLIARVAETDATVLILGESGTGKELVARAIHAHSPRRGKPFVAVDCGTLAETLLETELFGHERGAFTGAVGLRKGLLEQAHQGTCFLDEIADISPALQSKLLRVLQEREVRRVGGSAAIEVDVRILAATNKDLERLVEQGKFREDLFYRLNVVTIKLPPLRDRPEDIPVLAQHFLQRYGDTEAKRVLSIAPEAMTRLTRYGWPGNVRELEHTIRRAIVLTPHSMILPEDLPAAIQQPSSPPGETTGSAYKTLEQLEREHILRVLDASQGDQDTAARALGIHRKTLLRKLRRYGHA